jgi:PAS domain S-box-containing protein
MSTARFRSADINRAAKEFDDVEGRLLAIREQASEASGRTSLTAIIVGNVLCCAMLLLTFSALRRQNAARARAETALKRANQELESRVEERTGEVARANAALVALNASLEQRVAERTAELEDLYNNAPCGYHSVDGDGTFVRMNDTELAWLGYRRDEVVGKMRHHDLHTPDSLERYRLAFEQFKHTGLVKDAEFEYVRKDGSTFPVALNATAIRDDAGNYVTSRTTIYDISTRKRAEREIALLNSNLQQRAQLLEATNKELESFSYSVSHDLRAPLRAIDGYALMLEEDYATRLDEEAVRFLAVIRSNSRRMGTLIDDLLAFSRLGRQSIAKAPLDMKRLVLEVVEETRQGNAANVEVEALPPARADRALMRQVWVNLISNAFKYSGRATGPAIRVSGRRNGTECVYSVSDNGVGFDMAYSAKLFGVFQRLHRAEEFSGTGVGLAIVHRVVTRHGGRVWAEGKVNCGATFSFALPVGDGDE